VKTATSSEEYKRAGHVEVVSARSRDKEANMSHDVGRQAKEHRRSRLKSHTKKFTILSPRGQYIVKRPEQTRAVHTDIDDGRGGVALVVSSILNLH